MNTITSFKNRKIDFNKKVSVYRNLNKKGVVYSLKQANRVVSHATNLNLKDCEFKVNEKSRNKIRLTGKKIVHAYITGLIINEEVSNLKDRVIYNPKTLDGFTNLRTNEIIKTSNYLKCSKDGVHI